MTSLSTKLAEREAAGKPIQIGLIGAGKFGSMLYVPRLCEMETDCERVTRTADSSSASLNRIGLQECV